ncbi:PIN domain-containing protein [Candidatus Woesearchaeota archaeon]|nr:PIN domain-containing protein [Candidatus Woesearchaeota archaeon]
MFIDTGPLLDLLAKADDWRGIGRFLDKNEACTSSIVLAELKFKFLWSEAARVFGIESKKYELVRRIKGNAAFTRQAYRKYLEFYVFLASRIEIFALSKDDEVLACELAMRYSLLPNDALILACMIKNGVNRILTFDSDFSRIPEIEVCKP